MWIGIIMSRNQSDLFIMLNPPKFYNVLDRFYLIGFWCIGIKPYSNLLDLLPLQYIQDHGSYHDKSYNIIV